MANNQDAIQNNVVKTAADYTIGQKDVYVGVTSTAAARTISTTAADQIPGRYIEIKDESGAAATNNITFNPSGSITVDGALTKVINSNYGALRLRSDGTNWFSV